MKQWLKAFLVLSILCACSGRKGESTLLRDNKAKVLVFISPDCPLCKNYTKDLNEMLFTYGDQIDFYGVVPGEHNTKQEVDSFLNYYNLPLDIIYDPDFSLVKDLEATITPEAYLLDENNKIRYQGLFDNWLGELGRRRRVITDFYLKDAVESYLKNEEIKIKKTKAIGCFIE